MFSIRCSPPVVRSRGPTPIPCVVVRAGGHLVVAVGLLAGPRVRAEHYCRRKGPERFLFRSCQVCILEGGSCGRGSQLMECPLGQGLQGTPAILTKIPPNDLGRPTAWDAQSRRAAAALLAGRLEETDELIGAAGQAAEDMGSGDAVWIHDIQRWELARFQTGRGGYRRRHPRGRSGSRDLAALARPADRRGRGSRARRRHGRLPRGSVRRTRRHHRL